MKNLEWSDSQRQIVGWLSPGSVGRVERESFLSGYRVSVFCKMKRVLRVDGGDVSWTVWIYLTPLNYMLTSG